MQILVGLDYHKYPRFNILNTVQANSLEGIKIFIGKEYMVGSC